MIANRNMLIAGGLLAVGFLWWVTQKNNAGNLGQAVGGAAVNLAAGTVAGSAIALGNTVGIPQTNMTQCQIDTAAGNKLAASFSCPASDFLSWLFTGKQPAPATTPAA